MTTLIIEKEYNSNDEKLLINVTEDRLYNNNKCSFMEEESEDFKPKAPPSSPEQKPMMDFLFTKKLNESLEVFILDNSEQVDPLIKHAKVLDKLLRKSLNQCNFKKRQSVCQKTISFKKHVLKTTDNIKSLRRLSSTQKELEERLINELKEMGF